MARCTNQWILTLRRHSSSSIMWSLQNTMMHLICMVPQIWGDNTICWIWYFPTCWREHKEICAKVHEKILQYAQGVNGTILTPLSALTSQQSKRKQWNESNYSLTMLWQQNQLYSLTTKKTWFLQCTTMQDTWTKKMQEAEQVDITFSHKYCVPPKKWYYSQCCRHHHQSSNVFHCKSQVGSIIHQCMQSSWRKTNLTSIRQSVAAYAHAKRQINSRRIINSRVQPKHTKAMNIRIHWLHDWGKNQSNSEFSGSQTH